MPESQHLVLIVDDDQAVRDALQFALQLEGLRVRSHGGGAELLADAELLHAACVIIDIKMPHMDGFELLGRLREREPCPPAILLTSHATAGLRARADAAGAHRVLEKPLLDNVLLDSIRGILAGEASRCRPEA